MVKRHLLYDYENADSFDYDDLIWNCDIKIPTRIICLADLGLWNGRKRAYRIIESDNIKSCFTSSQSPVWYVTSRGDLCCDEYHHDGVNYILYRGIKSDCSREKLDGLLNKWFKNEDVVLSKCTYRLGDFIGKAYGWTFPNPPKHY